MPLTDDQKELLIIARRWLGNIRTEAHAAQKKLDDAENFYKNFKRFLEEKNEPSIAIPRKLLEENVAPVTTRGNKLGIAQREAIRGVLLDVGDGLVTTLEIQTILQNKGSNISRTLLLYYLNLMVKEGSIIKVGVGRWQDK